MLALSLLIAGAASAQETAPVQISDSVSSVIEQIDADRRVQSALEWLAENEDEALAEVGGEPALDDPDAVPPGFHIFHDSRIVWFETADDLPRHARFRPDTRGLEGTDPPQ
mgnify:CR=1 FL=1